MSTNKVSFSIEGTFLNNRVKDYVLEQDFFGGIEFLCLNLEGMTYDQALEVLKGNMKFIGNSRDDTLSLTNCTNDEVKDYVSQVQDVYRNYFYIDNSVYKIYNIRSYVQYEDYKYALENSSANPFSDKFTNMRMMYYAESPSDIALYMNNKFCLLKKVCISIPKSCKFFINSYNDKTKTSTIPIADVWSDYQCESFDEESRIFNSNKIEHVVGDNDSTTKISYYKQLIVEQLKQLDSKMYTVTTNCGAKYNIPLCMLHSYINTFNYTAYTHIETDYEPVSYSGIKLPMDSPSHTDILIYLGFNVFELDYDDNSVRNINIALIETASKLIMKHKVDNTLSDEYDIIVLSSNKTYNANINAYCCYHDDPDNFLQLPKSVKSIVIIPEASPKYQLIAEYVWNRGGIIMTKLGGPLCHLAKIANEYNGTIIKLADETAYDFLKNKKVIVDLHKDYTIKLEKILDR